MTNAGFEELLSVGGKSNSLGKANEVLAATLLDKDLLDELYASIKSDNAWVRMRAVDTFEKVCRVHPEWIVPYIDTVQHELSGGEQQASIKWHLAQLYSQLPLNDTQQDIALTWLAKQLRDTQVDWIVAVNCMKTLAHFTQQEEFPIHKFLMLLAIQESHKSKAVVKKAHIFKALFSA